MKHLKSFRLHESIGIANPTLIYTEVLVNLFKSNLKEYLKSGKLNFSKKELITKEDLSEIMEDPNWEKMPVSSIEVEFLFEKLSNDEFSTKYPEVSKVKNYNSIGSCYSILNKSEESSHFSEKIYGIKTIHLKMELGGKINQKFSTSDIEGLLIEAESAIYHELNHAYENIKRKEYKSGSIPTNLTYSLDANRSKIKKEIWKKWERDLSFPIYWSEKHEMNAMVQDAWSYVKRYEYKEMIKKCPTWIYTEKMINFKSSKFKEELSEMIVNLYGNKVDPIILMNRLKNGLANEIISSNSKNLEDLEDKSSLTGEKIKKMSLDKFLNYIEKRVNISGIKIRRKIIKLYSLK